MSGLLLRVTGRALLMSPKGRSVLIWSCLNWLGGILIIVFLHIHFNNLLTLSGPIFGSLRF